MPNFDSEARAQFPFNGPTGFDHLAWAKRIMYRHERKDSDLTITQVKDAKMALNIDQKPKQ